jgi:hypothetical protein
MRRFVNTIMLYLLIVLVGLTDVLFLYFKIHKQ